ncbi:hypothetical protein J5N97_006972 [Dioscorea zingiberensis]|uniref:14-3-3 domain-containing protein n=1 Tax=Dioscorea zingiberensis TaxID=325984 RepID=A0A9D5DB45_9LILI|nr:hypothetical protein J5N97_006972 [Dioscorea zingiberensis]
MGFMEDREKNVSLAKLAEQAERYEDMVEYMKNVAKMDIELTSAERQLLSVGYKNLISVRRASWQILSSLAQSEDDKRDEHNARKIMDYLRRVEDEITKICNKAATSIATAELPPTHPIRLGLALNFSVFHYEILNSPDRACHLARRALDEAITKLSTLCEESYKDSTLIMQLLKDNLTLWTSDLPEDGEESSGTTSIDMEL